MQLKKKLSIEAHHKWSDAREGCCDCGRDYKDGYLAGFEKARELSAFLASQEAIDLPVQIDKIGEEEIE